MLRKAVHAAVLTVCSFSVMAEDASGSMRWSENVPSICGIQINEGGGGITFSGEAFESSRPTSFSVKSNSFITDRYSPDGPGAYLTIEIDEQSDNLADITDDDSLITIKGQGVDRMKDIKDWRGAEGSVLPAGEYQSWLWVNKKPEDVSAGEAYMTTTYTVSCMQQ